MPRAGKGATTGAGAPEEDPGILPGTGEDPETLPGIGGDQGIGRGTPETGITRGLREIATGGTADLQETGKGGAELLFVWFFMLEEEKLFKVKLNVIF